MVEKWITRLVALFCVLSAAFLIADAISGPDEPAFCSLCHGAPLHAPALLNIETGDLTELRIYEPHPHKAGELAANQQGGYIGISMNGGVYFTYDPDAQTARTTIALDQARLHKSEFCKDCRKLLADSKHNYVLVDVYDQENISVYDIVEGICCEMRCYIVSVDISGDKTEVTIIVNGNLNQDWSYIKKRNHCDSVKSSQRFLFHQTMFFIRWKMQPAQYPCRVSCRLHSPVQ